MDRPAPPPDRGYFVWSIFCLLGVATLLPWNVFITENDYFDVRVHQRPTYEGVADSFESAIVIVFQFVNFVALLALIPLQRHIPLHQQVLLPLALIFAVLAWAAVVAAWTSLAGAAVILTMLPGVGSMGLTTALLQGGVLGLAGLCPPIYATSVGMAVAGFGVSVLSFVTIWAAPSEHRGEVRTPADVATAARAYFGSSAAVVAASAAGYWALQHLPFWHHHTGAAEAAVAKADEEEKAEGGGPSMLRGAVRAFGERGTPAADSLGHELDDVPLLRASSSRSSLGTSSPALPKQLPGRAGRSAPARMRDVLWALRGHSGALALNFAFTIAVFPSVTASICSSANPAKRPPCFPHAEGGRLAGDLWSPLLFLVFNGGDLLGRLLAGVGPWKRAPLPTRALLAYALARALLVVGLLLCHVITPHPWRLPDLLRPDVFPLGLTLLLGVTNGHLCSLASMHMPSLLPLEQRKQSGPVMAFAITFGLTVGSILAVLLMSLLQQ